MSNLINYIKYLRWNLKWLRYPGKPFRHVTRLFRKPSSTRHKGAEETVFSARLKEQAWDQIYLPDIGFALDQRHLSLAKNSASFVDVSSLYKAEFNACVSEILSAPAVTERILDYFSGEEPWLWNAALNYSIPKEGMSDSQFWHFDYGDSKQLHLFYYVTDVSSESGPFSFMPKQISERILRNPLLIERLTDKDLADRYSIDPSDKNQLVGTSGDLFFTDPGVLLHQGARCSKERMVLFITVSTSTPYDLGGRSTMNTSARRELYAAYDSASVKETSYVPLFTKEFFFK